VGEPKCESILGAPRSLEARAQAGWHTEKIETESLLLAKQLRINSSGSAGVKA